MNKLSIGDYVRLPDGIHKIKHYEYRPEYENCHCMYLDDNDYGLLFTNKDLIESSPNIIDLIEVGDIITTNNLCGEITSIKGKDIYTTCYDGEWCTIDDIKSIVTKESFENISYKVGE